MTTIMETEQEADLLKYYSVLKLSKVLNISLPNP